MYHATLGKEGARMGNEEPLSQDPPRRSAGRFWAFWTTLPGVLTGVAALITAVIGLVTLFHSAGGSSAPPVASTSENGPAVVSTSEPSTTGQAPGVLAHGQLSMSPGDHADLEHGRVGNAVSNGDLSLLGAGVGGHVYELTSLGGSLAPVSGRAINRATCVAALNAHTDSYEYLSGFDVGSQLCVQTSENNVAVVRIVVGPGVGSKQFVYAYTVWQ
jgi:hypothetical protein